MFIYLSFIPPCTYIYIYASIHAYIPKCLFICLIIRAVINVFQVQLEPTHNGFLIHQPSVPSSKYYGVIQALKDILREEGILVTVVFIIRFCLFHLRHQPHIVLFITIVFQIIVYTCTHAYACLSLFSNTFLLVCSITHVFDFPF
jgi:hypothetical protein